MKHTRDHIEDLRGASRLAIDATKAVTDLVQAMHVTIAGGPDVLGRPLESIARLLTTPVYESIRSVTGLVGGTLDAALRLLGPLVREGAPGPEQDAVLAALNGVLGDYLAATKNPLAIEMQMTHDGHVLQLDRRALAELIPNAARKVVVVVHGLCANERCWDRRGHDHGKALAVDLGFTPVYARYNSGLHISENGRALASMLEDLVAAWPVDIEAFAIVAHSMGGLVARSACHYAELSNHSWRRNLQKLVCLGSPHHGAHLERGGSIVDLLIGVSRYSAPLGKLARIRSAGVTDLRFGYVLDEHWEGRDRFDDHIDTRTPLPLPSGVACYAIAATMAATMADGPSGSLPGDGLVPVDSAFGKHEAPELTLEFPEERRKTCFGLGHLDLLDSQEVYATLRSWLSS